VTPWSFRQVVNAALGAPRAPADVGVVGLVVLDDAALDEPPQAPSASAAPAVNARIRKDRVLMPCMKPDQPVTPFDPS